jgi:hypothetical protein
MLSSLQALSVNSIVLMQKAGRRALKPQEVKDLLASVREISVAEAPNLESITTIGGVISEHSMPLLAFAKQDEDLNEVASFFTARTPSVDPAYLGMLLLTRHGTWQAGDGHLLFKWDGGSAKIRAKALPQSEIGRKVELFNSVSGAVSQADVTAPPSDSRPPKVLAKTKAAFPRNGSSNGQRRPQTPRRVEVLKRPEMAAPRSPPSAP